MSDPNDKKTDSPVPAEGDLAAGGGIWWKRTLWFVAAVFVFRLVYAALVPIDLVHDEAYYWDWSRQLDWGYYSKPPMVAWLIALATSLGGSSTFVVRLPAIVLGTAGLLVMYLLAARFYGTKAGFWAAVLSAATPGSAAMGLLMTIDAPFLFCWCVSLYATWRWLEAPANRGRWLVLATIATGLGILSKQTMLGFIPLTGIYLLTSKEDRRELIRPAFWIWSIGSLLFLTPVLVWNARHDWITLQHTSEHFAGEPVSFLRHIVVSLEFVAVQLGVASPVTCALYGIVGFAAMLAVHQLGRRERFLLCFSILPMAGVLGLSLLQRVEANWPASFYPSGVVLVVGWALGFVNIRLFISPGERHLRRAAFVGAVCVVLTYIVPFGFGFQGTKLDPVVRLRGWHQLGHRVSDRYARLPELDKTFFVVIGDRATAAELAFYMPEQPRVYVWSGNTVPASQYDIWGGPADKGGWNAVVVTAAEQEPPPSIRAAFDDFQPIDDVRVDISPKRKHHVQLWRGVGFRQWPDTARLASPETKSLH